MATTNVEVTCLQGLADLEQMEGHGLRGWPPATWRPPQRWCVFCATVLDRMELALATTRLDAVVCHAVVHDSLFVYRVVNRVMKAPQALLDRIAEMQEASVGVNRLFIVMGQLGDFDSMEYAQALVPMLDKLRMQASPYRPSRLAMKPERNGSAGSPAFPVSLWS